MKDTSILNPRNWFLDEKGKKILHAKRHYYGESLERALNDLNNEPDSYTHQVENTRIDAKWKRISAYEHDKKLNDLKHQMVDDKDEKTEKAYKLADLEIDKKHGKVSDQDYDKRKATINNEPWVVVSKVVMDPSKPTEGFFELDWNDQFVQQLLDAGYRADSKDMVVQKWFDNLCHNIAKENGAIFPAEGEKPEEFAYKAAARKVQSEDGKTEIS